MRLFITLAVLLACACGAGAEGGDAGGARNPESLKSFPAGSMGVHVTGGKQGRNDWYVVDLQRGDFYVMDLGRKSMGRLSPAELARLRKAVETSPFFSWKSEYATKSRGADLMTTEIVYDNGKRRHRVVHVEPAGAPAGFIALARRFELLAYAPYWHSFSYQYVSGRLQHVDLEGGFWTIVYATGADAEKDKYGGKLVLDIDSKLLSGFKDGDLVLLTGVVDTERMGIQMAGTHYRVTRLEALR